LYKKEATPSKIAISIIVLTLNEEKNIGRCLDSIMNQDLPKDRVEIIVVDGDSEDRTREIAEKYTSKILIEKKHNFGYARNLGVRSAAGDYIVFISADAWADNGWLKNIQNTLSEEEIDGVVGKQIPVTASSSWVSRIRSAGFQETYGNDPYMMIRGDNFSTVNCAYKKRAILEVGGFDESLPACEDQDLAHRVLCRGGRIVYNPEVIVHHAAEDSLKEILRKTLRQGVGEGVCSARHQIWENRLYLSILLLTLMILPSILLYIFPETPLLVYLGSIIALVFLATTWYRLRVLKSTNDIGMLLGAYLYYPLVGAAELLGFLIGRVTVNRYPSKENS